MRVLVTALATMVAVTAMHVPAAAQPGPTAASKQEAASRFRKGLDLFKDGDYQAALIEFRRAYDLAPNYQVLYNIGQVSFQLQDYPGALAALQRYLNEGGRGIPANRRAEVERDIEKLKQRVANLEIVVNVPDVDITIDDVAVGKSPLGKPILVSAGKHKVVVSRAGYTSGAKLVEIASQESQRVAFELTETASPVAAPIPPLAPDPKDNQPAAVAQTTPPVEKGPSYTLPIIAWSATGALTVGAVITGVLALGASSDLKTARDTQGVSRSTLDSAGSKTTTFALLTDILGGTAIAAAGVSIYLTVSAGSSSSSTGADKAARAETPRPTVRLSAIPGGVSLAGSF